VERIVAPVAVMANPSDKINQDNFSFSVAIKDKLMAIYEPYKNQQTGEYPIRLSSDSKKVMLGGAMPIEIMKATIELLFTY
jgi:hypothetical protein